MIASLSGDDDKRIVETRVANHADEDAPSISVATEGDESAFATRSNPQRLTFYFFSSFFSFTQAIADLALEIESSGGKTSAYLAMREAADRARLRYELQQASWCWDKYCEDSMRALGVSERAEQMLHEGQRIDEAMDFERELIMEDMAGGDASMGRRF